jgi:regulator of protease activity HflC (stomatin/prohibitin superfamily)
MLVFSNSKPITKLNVVRYSQPTHSRNQNANQSSDYLMRIGKFSSRPNVCINFLSAGCKYVVERFGKFSRVENPGLCFLIPFVDRIAYVVDERELCIRIDPELATSGDNVQVSLGGNLYVQFYDAEKASYGASTPIYAVSQFAQSVMRTAVGGLKLDTLFSERAALNTKIREELAEGTLKWGCKVIRFELTDIQAVDQNVAQSLHKQSTAERERREKIISAEAFKTETQLKADAYKYKQITEAEGDAEKTKITADADVYKTIKLAEAERQSIGLIASAMEESGGYDSMKTRLSIHYFDTLKTLGGKSTIIIPQNLGDVASMIAAGQSVFSDLNHSNKKHNDVSKE